MLTYPKSLLLAISLGAFLLSTQAVQAQQGRNDNPNMRNFYMARQQWTITDESPQVNDQRTGGGPMQQGGPMQGGGGPPALPKAGFIPYSQTMPGMSTQLPKVNNGVPPKLPPTNNLPAAMKGKAGAFKPPKPAAAKAPVQSGPPSVKAYQAYKGYTPGVAPPPVPSYQSSGGMSANTNVQGSVLHWARKKKSGY